MELNIQTIVLAILSILFILFLLTLSFKFFRVQSKKVYVEGYDNVVKTLNELIEKCYKENYPKMVSKECYVVKFESEKEIKCENFKKEYVKCKEINLKQGEIAIVYKNNFIMLQKIQNYEIV